MNTDPHELKLRVFGVVNAFEVTAPPEGDKLRA
jgi:hypothetical protein